jgi:cell division protein YceG involved in septum cleavage
MALSRGSRWFVAFGMLALAGVAGGLWWADTNVFVDDVEAGQPVEYTVERGQSVRGVGEDLAEIGVLRNPVRFRLAADEAGLAE